MDERWAVVLTDKELAEQIISMSPEKVRCILLDMGYDFTEEEIIETAKELNSIIHFMPDVFSVEDGYIT